MMTVYTCVNVPYGAMLGVMTDDTNEKTVFSSFRMFFAYGGSFIALFIWEPLTNALGGYMSTGGWFWAMVFVASACFVMFIISFILTREHLKGVSTVSVGSDFKSLLDNRPWWILIGAALCSNLFNVFLFYSGLFLGVGEVANMAGVALCVPIAKMMGKKSTFIFVNAMLVVLSIAFFYVPRSDLLQCLHGAEVRWCYQWRCCALAVVGLRLYH